jgi:UDP-glucose 4-epimerase
VRLYSRPTISTSGLGETLAELVRARADPESEVVLVPYDDAYEPGFEDMTRRVPNTEKIKTHTRWEPQLSLQDMIIDVIQHHRMIVAV